MNKKELINGLNKVVEGLQLVISTLEVTESEKPQFEADAPIKETPQKEEPKNNITVVPVHEEEVARETSDIPSEEELRKMKYNDFKKYASSLGVNCKGTRDEILKRIDGLRKSDEDKLVEKLMEEETPKAEEPKKERKTSRPKKEEVVEEEVEQEEAVKEEPKPRKGKFAKKVKEKDQFDLDAEEVLADTPVEDVIEVLADVEIKATEKNVAEKLAYALREGLISLEDEEEDEEDIVEEDEIEDSEEVEESDEEQSLVDILSNDSYFEEYDEDGLNNPSEMSEERFKEVGMMISDVKEKLESEELTIEDIKDYLNAFASEDELENLDDSDLETLKFYIELRKRFIDNDGVVREPSDPYEVGEESLCCGHILKHIPKTNKYICEHCGTEYEAE